MTSRGIQDVETNRFEALLNPIRDIAASWGIDVAKELTDYAESLGININDTESDQPSQSDLPVDFAEAALLVQGSTSIYSRKVEHLYSLVYIAVSSLNQMDGTRNDGNSNADDASLKDHDADALLQLDEVDFLTLDDDIPIADPKTINLAESNIREPGAHDETRLLPVPPMLAHRATATEDQIGGVDYKMLSAQTHCSGALVMRGCPPVKEDLDILPAEFENAAEIEITQLTEPFDDDGEDMDHGLDDIFGQQSPSGNAEDLRKEEALQQEGGDMLISASQTIMQTARLYGFTSSRPIEKPPKEKKDPFLLLDPHQAMPNLDKPLNVEKIYKKPRKNTKDLTFFSSPWISSDPELYDTLLAEIPVNACIESYLSFPGLRKTFNALFRKRQEAKRKKAMLQKDGVDWDLATAANLAADDDEPHVDRSLEEDALQFEPDDGDDFELADNPSFDDALDVVGAANALSLVQNAEEQLGEDVVTLANSFEERCRKHLERTAWMWEQQSTDGELLRRVDEWKLRIQPVLDEEERRREFDIASYGEGILEVFNENIENRDTDRVQISNLLREGATFEVSRKFLATLMLANTYKIEIIPPKECEVSDFLVRMLLTDKAKDVGTPGKVRQPNALSKRARQSGSTPTNVKRRPLQPRVKSSQNAAKDM